MWHRLLMSKGGDLPWGAGTRSDWLLPEVLLEVSQSAQMNWKWPCITWPPGIQGSLSHISWKRSGRREDEWEEEEKNGAREKGRHTGLRGKAPAKMKNNTVGVRFDWAPGCPRLYKKADERNCICSGKNSPDGPFIPLLSLFIPYNLLFSSCPLPRCPQGVGWKVGYIIWISQSDGPKTSEC